ncbi:MAG: hypothetical protein EOP06_14435, partial [Proteobacteria bacterium]
MIDKALLDSKESSNPDRHHVFSLGLAVDTYMLDQRKSDKEVQVGAKTPPIMPNLKSRADRVSHLIENFYRHLTDSEAIQIERLAVTSTWDKQAFGHVLRLAEKPEELDVAWDRFLRFSFVKPNVDGSYSLHAVMRKVTVAGLDCSVLVNYEEEWKNYWRQRSSNSTDIEAARAWAHAYRLDGQECYMEWVNEMGRSRMSKQADEQGALVDIWRGLVLGHNIDTPFTVTALYLLAEHLRELPEGSEYNNLSEAVYIYKTLLPLLEDPDATEWRADVYFALGSILARYPSEERAATIAEAMNYFELAGGIYTRTQHPTKWAWVQNGIANCFLEMPGINRAENVDNAILRLKEALQVLTRDSPNDRAVILGSLGNAYEEKPDGNRVENIELSIAALEESLSLHTVDNQEFRARALSNLGIAYANRWTGSHLYNTNHAIDLYNQALSVLSEKSYPLEWARLSLNVAAA